MAKTIITTDDLDGSANAETVRFSFAGSDYELDLSKRNRASLEKLLKPYLEVARPVSRGRRSAAVSRPKRSSRPTESVDRQAIRTWAEAQGITVSTRGRISAAVLEQYKASR